MPQKPYEKYLLDVDIKFIHSHRHAVCCDIVAEIVILEYRKFVSKTLKHVILCCDCDKVEGMR